MKDIPGYEGLYAITEDGKVWSYPKANHQGKWLLYGTSTTGYYQVRLCKNNLKTHCSIHRLIALTYIPNLENKLQVNHIDANKLNNNIENLEWCTPLENVQHAYKMGLRKHHADKSANNPNNKPIKCLTTNICYHSMSEARRQTKINIGNIHNCCTGRTKSAGKHPITGEKLKWVFLCL